MVNPYLELRSVVPHFGESGVSDYPLRRRGINHSRQLLYSPLRSIEVFAFVLQVLFDDLLMMHDERTGCAG